MRNIHRFFAAGIRAILHVLKFFIINTSEKFHNKKYLESLTKVLAIKKIQYEGIRNFNTCHENKVIFKSIKCKSKQLLSPTKTQRNTFVTLPSTVQAYHTQRNLRLIKIYIIC